MAQEGQIATGPNGQRAVYRGGQWVVMPSGPPQMPADPTFPLQAPKVQSEIASTQANAQGQQIDNRVAGATVGATIAKTEADATSATRTAQTAGLPEGFMWGPDGKTAMPIPGYSRQGLSPEIRSQAIQVFSDADALERTADELERLYKAGPGATKGVYGIQDYLPTDANKVFNDAGQQARGYVKRALGFTGGEGNTVAESSALYDPYLPSAGDRDAQIEAKIAKLRALASDARKKSTATLGGAPDSSGNIVPLPNAMTQTRAVGGDPLQAAAFGATTGVDQYPPDMLAAHAQLVQQLMAQGGGKIDPQAYAAARGQLNEQFGFSGDPQSDAAWAVGVNDYLSKGGKNVPVDIQPPERDLSGGEQFRNNLVNNPVGAAAVGALDMGGFGGVSLLAGDQVQALGEANPVSMTLGQVAGSITGASALGKLGAGTVGKVAPKLLGGGGKAGLAREVGTDAVYSGVTGMNQGGDPLTSAALGTAGTLGGRVVGKTVGATVRGAKLSPAVQALRARGIPMTVGQTLGGSAKSIEDAATSVPIVGDMIGRRYRDSLEGLSTAAAQDVGAPIGYAPKPGMVGKPLMDDMGGAISDYYTNTVAGANVPLDGQYASDFANVAQMGHNLPDDLKSKFGLALNNRVNPINDAGMMTGETYQQANRGLKSYKAENTKAGFEEDYRNALSAAQQALRDQMVRGGGQSVATGLDNADQAYRLSKTFEDAANRAKGSGYIPTASQLQGAVQATGKKFPGANPLAELADNAQEVLPSKLPDSGTARRIIQSTIGAAAIGGGAAGADAYFGTDIINPYSIGALALLTGGGTKVGQKALIKALADRPKSMTVTGDWLARRAGLFGRGAIPLALGAQ